MTISAYIRNYWKCLQLFMYLIIAVNLNDAKTPHSYLSTHVTAMLNVKVMYKSMCVNSSLLRQKISLHNFGPLCLVRLGIMLSEFH
jgi:hypothetical protein